MCKWVDPQLWLSTYPGIRGSIIVASLGLRTWQVHNHLEGMATKSALTAPQAVIADRARGRTVLVTAIYPAHPYGRERPSAVLHKLRSQSMSTGVAESKPAKGAPSSPPPSPQHPVTPPEFGKTDLSMHF